VCCPKLDVGLMKVFIKIFIAAVFKLMGILFTS
jgi:hypothetical protein